MTAPLNKGEEERAEFRNEIEDKGNWIEVFREAERMEIAWSLVCR